MWLLLFFVCYKHFFCAAFLFFPSKKVNTYNVLLINGLHSTPSSILPPHLAVVFHPARWIDEGLIGGGGSLHLLWGLVQAHETAGVLQKPIIEAPTLPPG